MSEEDINPFRAPVQASTPSATNSELDGNETALILQQTRPWTLTIGVLMIVAAAFMVLGGVGMLVVGATGGQVEMMAIAGFYVLMAAIYVIPAMLLLKYSSRISDYVASPDPAKLNLALTSQKSFWKFCGVAALIMVGLYALMFVGMLGFFGLSSM